jgi:tRNA(fMet)-specific endonuclease VapC
VKYLLDSNIIVYLTMNSNERVVQRAAECDEGDMVTSAVAYAEVAYAEVAYGSMNELPPSSEQLRAFVEEVPVLDFDYKAALAYATLPFKRGGFDRLIAAHALSHDLTIVTHNTKHFAEVPGLRVENWTV